MTRILAEMLGMSTLEVWVTQKLYGSNFICDSRRSRTFKELVYSVSNRYEKGSYNTNIYQMRKYIRRINVSNWKN